MKIVSVSHYYTPHIGGLEIVARKLARSLTASGHEVSIVTFKTDPIPSVSVEEGVTVYRVRGLNFFDTYFGIPFPIGGIGLFSRLFREIQTADAVHLHDVFYQSSWIAYFFARLLGKPLILTQHVGIVEHPSAIVMGIQKAVYRAIGRMIFAFAETIIVYNRNVRTFLEKEGVPTGKIIELRNGIDTNTFCPIDRALRKEKRQALGLPADRPLALFVGRFVPKKGFTEVYGARDPKYDLVFVGSGNFPEEYKKTNGVYCLGPKNQTELALIYPLVDFFVFPSKGEMFTLVMQEAMAAGLPIVTTNEPGYAEYNLDQTLITFVEPKAESLKTTMTKLVDDPELLQKMGAYSRALAVERFDWDTNISPLLSIYADIAKRKRVIVTTSWDDGHILDLKLADLLRKYSVGGTFYISPRDHEIIPEKRLSNEQIRSLLPDFEIGAHTMTHRPLPTISDDAANEEIITSKKYLEEVIGGPVTSFCYPRGEYTPTHAIMTKQAGFHLSRTVARFSYDTGSNPFELPTSVHTYDHFSDVWGVLRLAKFNPMRFLKLYRNWEAQAIAMFDAVSKRGGIFHLWGHSWEVDDHNDWNRLERVLQYVGGRANVSYVANRELV